jgi:hypothetical protein
MSEIPWERLGGATLTDLGVMSSAPILPLMLRRRFVSSELP